MEKLAVLGGHPIRTEPWPAWPEFGAPERAALNQVLESREWGGFPSPNPQADAFNHEFARYVGTRFAVACANGTFSLTLALQAAGVERGAEVVTTAYSFVGTAGGILAAGAKPVFVDVLPDTYCIAPEAVAGAITERTAAILPVHLAHSMADMDRLGEIARARSLVLIEDCAHAHGMRWRDRGAGSIGDLGSFSMQSSKLLTAGEGGSVTTDSEAYAGRLEALVNCGRREGPRAARVDPVFGHNLRITEWQAGILRAQLARLPEQHQRRRARVERFAHGLAAIPGFSLPAPDPRLTPTYYQLIVRYDAQALDGLPRDVIIRALEAEGIPCSGRFYVPIFDDPLFATDPLTHPMAAAFAGPHPHFPVAARAAYDEAIWLPHPLFLGSDADVDCILGAFAKIHEQAASLHGLT